MSDLRIGHNPCFIWIYSLTLPVMINGEVFSKRSQSLFYMDILVNPEYQMSIQEVLESQSLFYMDILVNYKEQQDN